MIYVFPHFSAKEKEIRQIDGISRLFAYPCEPHFDNKGQIVILDSGAFGLYEQGRKMTDSHMKKLSAHYEKYHAENVLCIAPDEFLNPATSMLNCRKWLNKGYFKHITPVLQAEKKGFIDIDNLKYQADFYRQYSDTVCFSNNGLMGTDAKYLKLERITKYCKDIGFRWLHVLGAGWNIDDILSWSEIKYIDSIDSIAYYSKDFLDGNAVDNIRRIRKCLKI